MIWSPEVGAGEALVGEVGASDLRQNHPEREHPATTSGICLALASNTTVHRFHRPKHATRRPEAKGDRIRGRRRSLENSEVLSPESTNEAAIRTMRVASSSSQSATKPKPQKSATGRGSDVIQKTPPFPLQPIVTRFFSFGLHQRYSFPS